MSVQKQIHCSSSGNVFFWVLICIVLISALSYMMMKTSSTQSSGLSRQQAKLYAQEIIDYGKTIDRAFNRLIQKGCSENEISFVSSAMTFPSVDFHYGNPNAPSDERCHIFSPNGGNVEFGFIPSGALASQPSGPNPGSKGDYVYSARTRVCNLGTTDGDPATRANNLRRDVCEEINLALHGTKIIPQTQIHNAPYYKGTAIAGHLGMCMSGDVNAVNFRGMTSFCYEARPSPGAFNYVHVFLVK